MEMKYGWIPSKSGAEPSRQINGIVAGQVPALAVRMFCRDNKNYYKSEGTKHALVKRDLHSTRKQLYIRTHRYTNMTEPIGT